MVHALKEAWRVLPAGGIMIDVRPLSVVIPLEVVYEGVSETAGMADMSPDLETDIAADKALETVLGEGMFKQSSMELFDYAYYWKTYHGMVVDLEERWQDEIIISKEVFENTHRLYSQHRPSARIRLPMRMKLGKFIKLG